VLVSVAISIEVQIEGKRRCRVVGEVRMFCRLAVLLFVVGVNAAVLFEVLDFPPIWGLADAHSLWHALTAPITALWYRFIIKDYEHLCSAPRLKSSLSYRLREQPR
jgi:hypothetical protein